MAAVDRLDQKLEQLLQLVAVSNSESLTAETRHEDEENGLLAILEAIRVVTDARNKDVISDDEMTSLLRSFADDIRDRVLKRRTTRDPPAATLMMAAAIPLRPSPRPQSPLSAPQLSLLDDMNNYMIDEIDDSTLQMEHEDNYMTAEEFLRHYYDSESDSTGTDDAVDEGDVAEEQEDEARDTQGSS